MENVSKGIEYGRRHGLSNNVDFEDVLATLALVTNNFPEVFQRLLNLHDNGTNLCIFLIFSSSPLLLLSFLSANKRIGNAQNFMTDTFAEVVKFMGYKKEIIDELERAWQGVRAIRKREPFIIVDFFKQLRRVYAVSTLSLTLLSPCSRLALTFLSSSFHLASSFSLLLFCNALFRKMDQRTKDPRTMAQRTIEVLPASLILPPHSQLLILPPSYPPSPLTA